MKHLGRVAHGTGTVPSSADVTGREPPVKRSLIISIAASMALTACGLKVPVTVGAQGGFGPGVPVDGSNGLPVDDVTDGGTDLPGFELPGEGDLGPGPEGPGSGPIDEGPGSDPGAVSSGLFANETEGIRSDSITLCAHVPITGAAPLGRDQQRFGQFYFNYVNDKFGGVHGRKVTFLAIDDQYNPTGARTAFEACRRQGAFIYLGAAGTDQIVSVAKLAEQYGVPYFHGPTSDKDMTGFEYNIHAAPTYEAQHRALARYLVKRYGKDAKYGMVRVNSVFFEAGHDAFVAELAKLGVQLLVDRTVAKDETSFSDVIADLRTKGVTVVNNFTTPNLWIKMIPQASGYRPTWTAVSPIAGFNLVASTLYANNAKAVVYQHFNPGCNCTDFENGRDNSLPYADHINEFVRIFKQYSPELKPPIDDFDYGAYISASALHRILLALGPDPTRSKLFELLKTFREQPNVTYPGCAANFAGRGERRGGHSVNILELQGGKWKQLEGCVDVGD